MHDCCVFEILRDFTLKPHLLEERSQVIHYLETSVPSPTLASSPCPPITTTASSVADTDTADYTCPPCPRTFTSRIGLVGHLRIHRTETGKPVPGAPIYIHRTCLHCSHFPRTYTLRMGLFGHMRIHENLR
ncbi:hypothetical protein SprV_0301316300 [Sparganum proliferum]